MAKYAKKFLTLLDELLTDIADNVTPGDLPNFRLTCKTLANIAAKQFGEKRLAYNRFIFTEYSLKGLVDMTAHLVFGPCIKSILFSTGHVTQDLMVVMNVFKKHNINDDTAAMQACHLFREHWRQCSTFLKGDDLPHAADRLS
ncbi:hypothetical protein E4T44_09117 [Aureobasidium sp. EXF-8845]|nr:hypothetical protein E4T44_09117 [Aureobasidium sp. EXF-8845]